MRNLVSHSNSDCVQLSRRAFLRNGTLLLTAATAVNVESLFAEEAAPRLRVALMTDLHYADKDHLGTRYYRETLTKLAEAATQYEKDRPDFLVELGDLIDAADAVETEKRYLETINRPFAAIAKDRHYVLGNHCVDTLTKQEFLGTVEQEKSYYSFDRKGTHFVVLDACFRSDGEPYGRKNSSWMDANIPAAEIEWLREDLKKAEGRVIVLAHQRLDGSNRHCVKNSEDVRAVLEESQKVLAVFQGHSHRNDHKEIGGIHYCTLAAMIEGTGAENNSYSILDVRADGSLQLHGYRRQQGYRW